MDLLTRDPGLSWSQLRAFEACSRLYSFNAAAALLGLTASAVRHQVGLLESRLGARLFERQGGRVALTGAGAVFARDIARPMRDLVAACAAAGETSRTAQLTLTAPPLFARQFLFDAKFLRWCDANGVSLDVTDLKRDLAETAPVAAVRFGAETDPDLVATPVLEVELQLAAAPEIAAKAKPEDVAWWAEQVLLTPGVSEGGWGVAWSGLGLPPDTPSARTLRFSSYASALEAACGGGGLILAPVPMARREFAQGLLAPIADLRLARPAVYSLVMRRDLASSPRGKALRRRIIAITQDGAGQ